MTFRDVNIQRDVPMRLSDGVTLYSDIYRPAAAGRFPVLLSRTPYDKFSAQTGNYAHPIWYARHGYVVVVQDVRGRYKSEGEFAPYTHDGRDGAETIAWAADLPGADGQVATYGFSYAGFTQLMAAVERPAALRAIAPAFTAPDPYGDLHYTGGALALGFNVSWALRLADNAAQRLGDAELCGRARRALRDFPQRACALPIADLLSGLPARRLAPFFLEWLDHPESDAYWQARSLSDRYAASRVPALQLTGWYDAFLEGMLRAYRRLTDAGRTPHRLVIGPWAHMPWTSRVGALDFGPSALNGIDHIQLAWFDGHLKGDKSALETIPPVRLFVMGANRWRDEDEWPPRRARPLELYLHSRGKANSLAGDGWAAMAPPVDELPDVYVYDPASPVPSLGGSSCCQPELAPMGPADQRPVEERSDVLVYTSDPIEEEFEVTGTVEAVLYASSSARDTDFTVKLVDVHPDGLAINLCDGIVRARYRLGTGAPRWLVPGEVEEYRIPVGSTSNRFLRGHRIRVEISSCNLPRFDRNPNTGLSARDTGPLDLRPALQTVYHEPRWPSRLVLPVIAG